MHWRTSASPWRPLRRVYPIFLGRPRPDVNSSDTPASLEAKREVQAAAGTRARSRETATSSGGQNREEQSLYYDLAMTA
jgi:hypothetical protein